jgi:hypothetical protein
VDGTPGGTAIAVYLQPVQRSAQWFWKAGEFPASSAGVHVAPLPERSGKEFPEPHLFFESFSSRVRQASAASQKPFPDLNGQSATAPPALPKTPQKKEEVSGEFVPLTFPTLPNQSAQRNTGLRAGRFPRGVDLH